MKKHDEEAIAAVSANLESYRTGGIQFVEMLVDDDACDICLAFKGKKFPLDKAPIPCRDTHPVCRCDLLPVLD